MNTVPNKLTYLIPVIHGIPANDEHQHYDYELIYKPLLTSSRTRFSYHLVQPDNCFGVILIKYLPYNFLIMFHFHVLKFNFKNSKSKFMFS